MCLQGSKHSIFRLLFLLRFVLKRFGNLDHLRDQSKNSLHKSLTSLPALRYSNKRQELELSLIDQMTLLLDLPAELLIEIIECTSAGDIGSLATCSKKFKKLAKKKLNFHRQMRAQAAKVVVGGNPLSLDLVGDGPMYPSKYLLDILEKHDSRFYTKVMEVGFLHTAYQDEKDGMDRNRAEEDSRKSRLRENAAVIARIKNIYSLQLSELFDNVYEAVKPYLGKIDFKLWTDYVTLGDAAAVVVLLLASYPNLKTLYIHDHGEEEWYQMSRPFKIESPMEGNQSVEEREIMEKRKVDIEKGMILRGPWSANRWGDVLYSLVAAAKAGNKMRILSRLSEIHLLGPSPDLSDPLDEVMLANADIMNIFITSPNLGKVTGRSVRSSSRDGRINLGELKITIPNLDLHGNIHKRDLLDIINGNEGLQHFRYRFYTPPKEDISYESGVAADRLKYGPRARDDAKTFTHDRADLRLGDDGSDDNALEDDVSDDGGLDDDGFARWEPRIIKAALLQSARGSLVSMSLTAGSLQGVEFHNDEPFIGSLRQFSALKWICIDTILLFKKLEHPSNVSTTDRSLITQSSTQKFVAQTLIEFLPKTIEKFTVKTQSVGVGFSKSDVGTMFKGLPEGRHNLPRLSEIIYEWSDLGSDYGFGDSNKDVEVEGYEELKNQCWNNYIEFTS